MICKAVRGSIWFVCWLVGVLTAAAVVVVAVAVVVVVVVVVAVKASQRTKQ